MFCKIHRPYRQSIGRVVIVAAALTTFGQIPMTGRSAADGSLQLCQPLANSLMAALLVPHKTGTANYYRLEDLLAAAAEFPIAAMSTVPPQSPPAPATYRGTLDWAGKEVLALLAKGTIRIDTIPKEWKEGASFQVYALDFDGDRLEDVLVRDMVSPWESECASGVVLSKTEPGWPLSLQGGDSSRVEDFCSLPFHVVPVVIRQQPYLFATTSFGITNGAEHFHLIRHHRRDGYDALETVCRIKITATDVYPVIRSGPSWADEELQP